MTPAAHLICSLLGLLLFVGMHWLLDVSIVVTLSIALSIIGLPVLVLCAFAPLLLGGRRSA